MDSAPLQQAVWHGDPPQLEMDAAGVQQGLDALVQGVREGQHGGGQCYVSRWGQPLVEFACGVAGPGRPMTVDSLTAWFSATKPVVAMGLALLYDRGRVDLDDPVRRYLPEFAHGKEACTLRHVLTHQGGFAGAVTASHPGPWERIISDICAYPAEYPPGTRAGYHSTAGWYVLAEIVRRVDGRPIASFLEQEWLAPLGMADSHLGIPVDRQAALRERLALVALGKTQREHFASQAFVDQFNGPAETARVNPSGGMRGPARDLGRFYECMLAKGLAGERRVVDKRTVELFTACHRWGMADKTLAGAPLPWGLGFILYGNADVDPAVSRRVFGHSGMVSSVAFADPASGLACVVITTGLLDPVTNAHRLRAVNGPIVKACRPVSQ